MLNVSCAVGASESSSMLVLILAPTIESDRPESEDVISLSRPAGAARPRRRGARRSMHAEDTWEPGARW